MDRACQVLAQGVPPGVPNSHRALADHFNIPRSTLHHHAREVENNNNLLSFSFCPQPILRPQSFPCQFRNYISQPYNVS